MNSAPTREEFAQINSSTTIPESRLRFAGIISSVIFYSLLALILLTAIPYGTVDPVPEAFFECTVFALTVLGIVAGLLGGSWQIKGLRLLLPLLALVVFAFFQTLPLWGAAATAGVEWRQAISYDPYETRLFALKLLALTLALALLLRHTSSRRRLRALIYVAIGVGVASAAFGLLRQTVQRDAPTFAWLNLGREMGYAQFVNRNHFALLAEMSLGLTLGLLAARGVRRDRMLFYVAATFVLWTTLVLSNSRGGIFSMLGQMIFAALIFVGVQGRSGTLAREQGNHGWATRFGSSLIVRIALAACLLVVVIVGMVLVGGDSVATRLGSVAGEIDRPVESARSGERRLQIWNATIQLIKAHPLSGSGFSGYKTAISKYHDASGEVAPQEAHNDYLELVAGGGLIGLVLAAIFVIALGKAMLEQLRSTDSFRRAACLGAVTGILAVAIHSLFDFGLHITVNALVMVALVVIATVNGQEETKKVKVERSKPAGFSPGVA